jgi:hypothetical protein
MPEEKTLRRAARAKRRGKSPSTQAGEFVREEIHHVREGKHGARSASQVIAIGLAKARRAGVRLPPPPKGRTSRSRVSRNPREAASHGALARHARSAARRRDPAARSAGARKAARTRARRST